MIKQKVYLLLESLNQISNLCSIVTFDWYLFRLIVLLKPDFNFCINFALSLVDKVTTGPSSFVSVIAKVVTLFTFEMTQFADQVRIRLILQLIKCISIVLQKLLKYFNDKAISAFKLPRSLVLAKYLALKLNELESVIRFLCHKLPVFPESWSLYSIKFHISFAISKYYLFVISICSYCCCVCSLSNKSCDSFNKMYAPL